MADLNGPPVVGELDNSDGYIAAKAYVDGGAVGRVPEDIYNGFNKGVISYILKQFTNGFNAFPDNLFNIYDDIDDTKRVKFFLDNVTTGTDRLVTIQDQDGTMALLSDVALKYDIAGGPITGAVTLTSTTDALRTNLLTTVQEGALAKTNGMVWYNTDLEVHRAYQNGTVVSIPSGTSGNCILNGNTDICVTSSNGPIVTNLVGAPFGKMHEVDFSIYWGQSHTMTVGATNSTISGGISNTIGAVADATIGGGNLNTVSNLGGTVGGGGGHTNTADYGTIPGGLNNVVDIGYGMAVGREAKARSYGQIAHAAGQFSEAGDSQHNDYVLRVTTTDAVETEAFLDGPTTNTERIVVAGSNAFSWRAWISSYDRDNDVVGSRWVTGMIKSVLSTHTMLPTQEETVIEDTELVIGLSVEADDVNNSIVCKVTGLAATTIDHTIHLEAVEMKK